MYRAMGDKAWLVAAVLVFACGGRVALVDDTPGASGGSPHVTVDESSDAGAAIYESQTATGGSMRTAKSTQGGATGKPNVTTRGGATRGPSSSSSGGRLSSTPGCEGVSCEWPTGCKTMTSLGHSCCGYCVEPCDHCEDLQCSAGYHPEELTDDECCPMLCVLDGR